MEQVTGAYIESKIKASLDFITKLAFVIPIIFLV